MCGGKGGSGSTSPTFSQPSPMTTTQNVNQATQQQQQYQANPLIQQYIQQALGQAGSAAQQPFSMPQQPIAGFTPLQQQYFQQLQNMQGMTDPYFQQAQNYMGQGANLINNATNFFNQGSGLVGQGAGLARQGIGTAGQQLGTVNQAQQNIGTGQGILAGGIPGVSAAGTPVTAGNIMDYMNPFAADTLAAMKKYVFDPQRVQTMGQQTQMAGGVGADRLALASQNLDKTQADAIAQAQAGFWQPAMAMAEQQKQMALQSGLGMGTLGQGYGNMAMNQGQLGLGAANVGLGMGNLGLGIGGLGGVLGGFGSAQGALGGQLANIGMGYGNLGTSAQNAALQATGALGAAGTQQQQLAQAQLMAPYNQQLAALAYPFQTAQFLSGITGGLAPALGGTTTGAGYTAGSGFGSQMPSQPAYGSQIFGLGAGILGGLGSLGAFNSPYPASAFGMGDPNWIGYGNNLGNYWSQYRGGAIRNPFARGGTAFQRGGTGDESTPNPFIGGNVKPGLVPGGYRLYSYQANDPGIAGTFTDKQAWLDMGGTQDAWDKRITPSTKPASSNYGGGPGMFGPTFWPNPDALIWKNFGPSSSSPTQVSSNPFANMQVLGTPSFGNIPGGSYSVSDPEVMALLGGGLMPMASGGKADDSLDDDISDAGVPEVNVKHLDIPHSDLPMGTGERTGAKMNLNPDIKFPLPWAVQQNQQSGSSGSSGKGSGIGSAIGTAISVGSKVLPFLLARGGHINPFAGGGSVTPFDAGRGFAPEDDDDEIDASDITLEHQGLGQKPDWGPAQENAPTLVAQGATPEVFNNEQPVGIPRNPMGNEELPAGASPIQYQPQVGSMDASRYMMPRSQMPYPDSTQRDWGQQAARSPWMSLIAAGAKMAGSTKPLMSAMAEGIGAGAAELESQRKELRTEEALNQRAEGLFQHAQSLVDHYTRKTPHQIATEAETKRYHNIQEQHQKDVLSQGKYQPVNMVVDGKTIAGWADVKNRKYFDAEGNEIKAPEKIIARQTGEESATSRASRAQSAAKDDPNYLVDQLGTINKWRAKYTLPPLSQSELGSSKEIAIPDPGEGKRVAGKWYIVNGVPKRWVAE